MQVEKKRILLIDDEEVILFGFSHVLTEPGIRVDTASSAEEARALVLEHDYAAALVDARLSSSTVMEGIELISFIKNKQPGCRVIMLTAYGEESVVRAALDAGADLFLEKPVDPELIKKNLADMGVY